jgi:hypothetical protein
MGDEQRLRELLAEGAIAPSNPIRCNYFGLGYEPDFSTWCNEPTLRFHDRGYF